MNTLGIYFNLTLYYSNDIVCEDGCYCLLPTYIDTKIMYYSDLKFDTQIDS